jgi:hypothetical protein
MFNSADLPEAGAYDVIVCGSGCAGVAAAIAASRAGARTLVVERWGFSGGYITAVYGPGLDGFVDLRTGRPIVGGIAARFARHAAGGPEDVLEGKFPPGSDLRNQREYPDLPPLIINIEAFKLWADRLLRQAGAEILYHTHVADVVTRGKRIEGVVLANKAGLTIARASQVVDATGDADVAAMAGVPYDVDEHLQPLSLHFRVAGIRNVRAELRDVCGAVLEKLIKNGELPSYGGPWLSQIGPDSINVNATRTPGDGRNPWDVTNAETQGREDAWAMFEAWKAEVPEFKDSVFLSSGPVAGVRETRRIRGVSQLTVDNASKGNAQADVVVKGAWYLDRHPSDSSGYHMHKVLRPYDIGYYTMVPQGCDNLLVAGRCHSADSYALASSRVTVTAMGMGEAAGIAAAMASKGGSAPADIDIATLQKELLNVGAIILDRAERVLEEGDKLGNNVPESKAR